MGESLNFESYAKLRKVDLSENKTINGKLELESEIKGCELIQFPNLVKANMYDFSYLPDHLRTRYSVNNLDFVVTEHRFTQKSHCWQSENFIQYKVRVYGSRNEEIRVVLDQIDELDSMELPLERVNKTSQHFNKVKELLVEKLEHKVKFFSACGFNVKLYWDSKLNKPLFQAESKEYNLFGLTDLDLKSYNP